MGISGGKHFNTFMRDNLTSTKTVQLKYLVQQPGTWANKRFSIFLHFVILVDSE